MPSCREEPVSQCVYRRLPTVQPAISCSALVVLFLVPKKLCSGFSARALTGLGHTVAWAEKGQILCWLLKILTIFLLGGWSQSSPVPALCLHGWLILPVRGAWKRFGSIHSGPWFAWYFSSITEFCPSGNVYQSPGTPPHLQRIGNISSCAWIWPCGCICL